METKQFVWNLTTQDLAIAMNETSATLPHGEDEFVRAGLTAAPSRLVDAHAWRRARSISSVAYRNAFSSPQPTALPLIRLVLGEVVEVHIDESAGRHLSNCPGKTGVAGRRPIRLLHHRVKHIVSISSARTLADSFKISHLYVADLSVFRQLNSFKKATCLCAIFCGQRLFTTAYTYTELPRRNWRMYL